ncbi:hypothetical protein M0R45_031405 [Rubus argutus]|uniref:Uncharacterized protein n=1 Tax=Rubus argutus TaxID=59490 RepID=A0AAW1WGC8_RUBAR
MADATAVLVDEAGDVWLYTDVTDLTPWWSGFVVAAKIAVERMHGLLELGLAMASVAGTDRRESRRWRRQGLRIQHGLIVAGTTAVGNRDGRCEWRDDGGAA